MVLERPVDVTLLAHTHRLLASLEEETGVDPGYLVNGGLFVASTKERLDEYKRLQTLGKVVDLPVPSSTIAPDGAIDRSAIDSRSRTMAGGLLSPFFLLLKMVLHCTPSFGLGCWPRTVNDEAFILFF